MAPAVTPRLFTQAARSLLRSTPREQCPSAPLWVLAGCVVCCGRGAGLLGHGLGTDTGSWRLARTQHVCPGKWAGPGGRWARRIPAHSDSWHPACKNSCRMFPGGRDCIFFTFDLPSIPGVANRSRQAYFSPLLEAVSHRREGGRKEGRGKRAEGGRGQRKGEEGRKPGHQRLPTNRDLFLSSSNY